MNTMTLKRTAAVLALAVTGIAPADAGTETDTLSVTATVLDSCTVLGGVLAFGNYDGTQLDGSGDVTVTCTGTTTWTVLLDGGVQGNISARGMTGGTSAEVLTYQLYTDEARSAIFGDGTTGSTVTDNGTGLAQTVTVYGRIPALGSLPTVDAYTDTVTVTVSW